MHSFPWYADLFFGSLALVASWQFWAIIVVVAAVVLFWLKH